MKTITAIITVSCALMYPHKTIEHNKKNVTILIQNDTIEIQKPQNQVDMFVQKYSEEYDVPQDLIYAVIRAESKGKHNSKSHKGAIGIMQLMPSTAKWLEVDPHDLEDNIKGGVKYLSMQLKTFKQTKLALAAYNAGPGNVYKYNKTIPPFKETVNYIHKICSDYSCV